MLNLPTFVNRGTRTFCQELAMMTSHLACQFIQPTHLSHQAVVILRLCYLSLWIARYRHNLCRQRELLSLQDLVMMMIEQLVVQITRLSFEDVLLLHLTIYHKQNQRLQQELLSWRDVVTTIPQLGCQLIVMRP
jgi:hypothetical protein